jgi:hypothetical protein
MTNSTSISQRIILALYGIVYFLGFVLPVLQGTAGEITRAETITIPLTFGVFLLGTVITYYNEKIGGILLLIWHFLVWLFAMMYWHDSGLVLVLVFPMIFPAISLIRNWHFVNYPDEERSQYPKTRYYIKVMLINYAFLYLLIVFFNFFPAVFDWNLQTHVEDLVIWNYLSPLGISLIISFILFIVAFASYWKNEVISGYLFIAWYFVILTLTLIFPDFRNTGPWSVVGLSMLIQGIYHIAFAESHHKDENTSAYVSKENY